MQRQPDPSIALLIQFFSDASYWTPGLFPSAIMPSAIAIILFQLKKTSFFELEKFKIFIEHQRQNVIESSMADMTKSKVLDCMDAIARATSINDIDAYIIALNAPSHALTQ